MKYASAICIFILSLPIVCFAADGKEQARQKVIDVLRSAGLDKELNAKVTISKTQDGTLFIDDTGDHFMQYMIVGPDNAAKVPVEIAVDVKLPASCKKFAIVTHGWFDKGKKSWPADLAEAINERVDPNEWACCFFDWQGGANVASPIDAAKYGRDIAGKLLGRAILNLADKTGGLEHVHIIGHSAGSWTINSAAKVIAAANKSADIHLTFLDAYIPPMWKKSDLSNVSQADGTYTVWAEHYYSKDVTLNSTEDDLAGTWNVDLTAVDLGVAEHEFPYRWYYATVAGHYRSNDLERNQAVVSQMGDLQFGFARSLEASRLAWQKSLALKKGQDAVLLKAPKPDSPPKWWR